MMYRHYLTLNSPAFIMSLYKKVLALIVLVGMAEFSSAQINQSKFFIHFTDKNNSPYSLSNPSAFLSAKAIARRTAQGIAYNNLDLPVNPQYISGVLSKGATLWARSKWF